MFDSLDEKIKHDESIENTSKERIVKGVLIAALSILLFGGLFLVVMMFE